MKHHPAAVAVAWRTAPCFAGSPPSTSSTFPTSPRVQSPHHNLLELVLNV